MKRRLFLTIIALVILLIVSIIIGMNNVQAATDNYYYPNTTK